MSWDWNYRPYVSAAQRRAKAERHAQKLAKKGATLAPVKLAGRAIASTFWGKAWCAHLEALGDYENRLPRGRTYVRNGSVLDVQLAPGKVTALVMGSSLYHGTITIEPLKPARWRAIKAECAGKIDSLVGLLQGRLSDAVMRVITDPANGLFPQPAEIKLACSCPDYADLCKHLAAVLYGVGARLDTQPELLFVLRGVDHLELISTAADAAALAPAGKAAVDAAHLSEVFGIEIEPVAAVAVGPPAKGKAPRAKSRSMPPVPASAPVPGTVSPVRRKKPTAGRRSAPKKSTKPAKPRK
ncbi:MAG: SWIM zinc finger family protein [Opitutae bacterium]|nr:SWIM zinc finger family protein [Opitutae bacterium]